DWSFLVDRVNEDTFKWYVNNTNDEIFKALFKTSRFKKMILDRFEELKKGALSDANILAMIDKYEAIIESDIERDRIRWGTSYTSWKSQVNDLRKFITSGRLAAYEKNLKAYLGG
ncbi:MAG: CotH kinase family protein, partial [Clostridia bacterium]|nr:CotH kinase family protein [Clostridia bacterium]